MERLRRYMGCLLSQGYTTASCRGAWGSAGAAVYTLIRTAWPVGYMWAHHFAAGMDGAVACNRTAHRDE